MKEVGPQSRVSSTKRRYDPLAFGLDYTNGPSVAALQERGVTFVSRYLSFVNELTQTKLLTADEAMQLAQGGIAVVSNYEWYESRCREGFDVGVTDAQIAEAQHRAYGGPPDRPIYFSVDEDVSGAEVEAYFRGVNSVIGVRRTGVYGSYRMVEYLRDKDLVAWTWQTYAWSNGQWDPRNNLEQYLNGQVVGGADVDFNTSKTADFGQWYPVASGRQPPGVGEEEDEMVHLDLELNKARVLTAPTVVGGKGWLSLSADFGTATVRVALKHRSRGWEAKEAVEVADTNDQVVICELGADAYADVTKISAKVIAISVPDVVVSLDITPNKPYPTVD
jgi:hypothetical protein